MAEASGIVLYFGADSGQAGMTIFGLLNRMDNRIKIWCHSVFDTEYIDTRFRGNDILDLFSR